VSISNGWSGPTEREDPAAGAPNAYRVEVRPGEDGLTVAILDPKGREVSVRACTGETEARTYASTVRQHIYWLSERKFREYYRLPEPAEG
jgi:hypothetical protein